MVELNRSVLIMAMTDHSIGIMPSNSERSYDVPLSSGVKIVADRVIYTKCKINNFDFFVFQYLNLGLGLTGLVLSEVAP